MSGNCGCGCGCGASTSARDSLPANDRATTAANCPVCGNTGKAVSATTVAHLVNEEHRKNVRDEGYRICMDEDCAVVYYKGDGGTRFLTDQIRVPVWFKRDADPKYVCYCSKVAEEQVVEAVLVHGARTVKEVNTITGAMRDCNCIEENPLGACCQSRMREVIEAAIVKGVTRHDE